MFTYTIDKTHRYFPEKITAMKVRRITSQKYKNWYILQPSEELHFSHSIKWLEVRVDDSGLRAYKVKG